jgi:excisionase family DNA binding protein
VDDLLTTRQLQEMVQLDRITIYRMLEDGRLQGFKVGGQWRFPRQDVERWLRRQQSNGPEPVAGSAIASKSPAPIDSSPLPLACVQAMQDILAEACQVASITLSADGVPITSLSNSCTFCNLILSTTEGRRRCLASWQSLKEQPPAAFSPCHAGLKYVTSPVMLGGQRIAIAAAGQLLTGPASASIGESWLANLSQACGLDPATLHQASAELPTSLPEHADRVSKLIQRTAATFAEMGRERWHLLERLQRIAQMTVVE